jgi:hypothetical protein
MGLRSPNEITRHHVFVNTGQGKSVPLAEIWPYPRGADPRQVAQPQRAQGAA